MGTLQRGNLQQHEQLTFKVTLDTQTFLLRRIWIRSVPGIPCSDIHSVCQPNVGSEGTMQRFTEEVWQQRKWEEISLLVDRTAEKLLGYQLSSTVKKRVKVGLGLFIQPALGTRGPHLDTWPNGRVPIVQEAHDNVQQLGE